jgi:hypothetical protein
MVPIADLDRLSDDRLITALKELVSSDNRLTDQQLVHLAKVG